MDYILNASGKSAGKALEDLEGQVKKAGKSLTKGNQPALGDAVQTMYEVVCADSSMYRTPKGFDLALERIDCEPHEFKVQATYIVSADQHRALLGKKVPTAEAPYRPQSAVGGLYDLLK
ncbi:hypothetical protein H6504_05375 [Candidatus Woesearchaeota archaeon]|nr:hypothetical protein [Candidatus Woesearchaeota archaeon]